MSVSEKEFEKFANLAKLEFEEAEKAQITEELDEIVEFARIVCDFAEEENAFVPGESENTDREMSGQRAGMTDFNSLRTDEVGGSLPREEVLSNAVSENGCFVVGQVKL